MTPNKYPKIIVDTDENTPNPLHYKNITVEEWEDYVLHHTHEGLGEATSDSSASAEVLDALNSLKEIVQQIQADINDIKPRIEKIEAYIDQDIQIDDSTSGGNGGSSIEDLGDDDVDDDF